MTWSLQQVAEHNSPTSCWVVIHNRVYDVTGFLSDHPGGAEIILQNAGGDATDIYEPVHPPQMIENHLPRSHHLGDLDDESVRFLSLQKQGRRKSKDEQRVEQARCEKPPLSRILNLKDMEAIARKVLPSRALAYYSSGADDEITKRENAQAFTRYFFHPRVLRPVGSCSAATRILGFFSSIPVFMSGTALAKLGHPSGETNLAVAAAVTQIPQMVSSNASFSPAAIVASIRRTSAPAPPFFYQLYKHRTDHVAAERIREVEQLGYKAIWLTVDAVAWGNRETDVRSIWDDVEEESLGGQSDPDNVDVEFGGTAAKLTLNDDADLSWGKTIPWMRSVTKLPLVLKGIQCVEDAVLAAEAGVEGILISNHGGRQLEYSLPPMEVLHRIRKQRPDVFDKLEVYIDGGITRGTDVLKALCLGATAVGLGRPFLYAQSAYGAEGAIKIVRILHREILTGMRLLGARNVRELTPAMVERTDWQPIIEAKL